MAPVADKVRPKWFWPLIAFLAGLLIGWWVIGWVIWPVKWNNALPPDLRAAERDHYLQMVAESYAATGNAELAGERLATWTDQKLGDDLARLQTRLAGANDQSAGQVQQLASVLGVEKGSSAIPAGEPTVVPAESTAPQSSSILKRVCTAGLWVILVLVGLAVILWLWNRWRSAKGKNPFGPASGGSPPGAQGRSAQFPASASSAPSTGSSDARKEDNSAKLEASLAKSGSSDWEEVASATAVSVSAVDVPSAASPDGTLAAKQTSPAPAVAPVASVPLAKPAKPAASIDASPRPSAPSGSSRAPVMAREFRAVYQMGEPDYDEAFDVADSSGAHLGQCGLELTEPVGRAHDQAAALQVWLWDTNDPDTKVKVLMSEGAYRDTALRAQLAAEHQAIPVREGTEFELESYKLLLRGAVEKIDYADQELPNGIFAEIRVRLQVYQKGR